MQLPDMTGLEVLQALKRNEGTRGLRVIALSANAMERDVSETLSAGARDYWTKPIDVPRFLQGLRQVLEKGSAELHGRQTATIDAEQDTSTRAGLEDLPALGQQTAS